MTSFRSFIIISILVASFSVFFIDAWIIKPAIFTASRRASLQHAARRRDDSSFVSSAFTSNSNDKNKDPFRGISNLIDDGNGNIRADLATSIWNWDKQHRDKDHLPKFEYSTRAGLRLVDEIARNLLSSNSQNRENDRAVTTYSDLVQEGVVALMYAMAKYSPATHNESFEHYAKRSIVASLTKVLAQDSRPIKLPSHVMDILKSAKRKRQSLLTKTGREPTLAHVAKELNVTSQQLQLYTMFGSTLSVERTMEIYDPLLENKATFADQDLWQQQHGVDVDDSNTEILEEQDKEGDDEMWIHLETVAAPLKEMIIDQDRYDNPNDLVYSNMIHDDVQDFLRKTLEQRELQVIELRYGLNGGKVVSLEAIGDSMGISASRVKQIEEQAMEKLRSSYTNRQVETYLEDERQVESLRDEKRDTASEEGEK